MDDIVDMMGYNSSLTSADRGVLTITNTSAMTKHDLQQTFSTSINFDALSTLGSAADFLDQFITFIVSSVKGGVLTSQGDKNFTVYFCSQCDLNGEFVDPHSTYTLLFNAILKKTGSVGPAYQSVLF